MLIEIKEYLDQTEEKWSISSNHIKLLFELYTNHLKEVSHSETLLTIFQNISLKKNLAELIVQNDMFVNNFIPKIKNLVGESIPVIKSSLPFTNDVYDVASDTKYTLYGGTKVI